MKQIVLTGLVLFIVVLLIIIFLINNKKYEPITSIKHFSYSFTTGNYIEANVIFEIDCEDKCIAKIKPSGVSEEDSYIKEIDNSIITEIIDILNTYKVAEWDGFNKSDSRVLDGNSFLLSIRTNEDRTISASGYMSWPKNYRKVKEELQKIFENIIR